MSAACYEMRLLSTEITRLTGRIMSKVTIQKTWNRTFQQAVQTAFSENRHSLLRHRGAVIRQNIVNRPLSVDSG